MKPRVDHDKKEIDEALGIDIKAELPWVEDYFFKYAQNQMKFSEVIESIVNDLRKKELGDDSGGYSKYELKLNLAGFLFGCYHTSYMMMSSGLVNIPGYGDLIESIRLAKEKPDDPKE